MEVITSLAPNVAANWHEFIISIIETVYMLAVSGFFSIILGLIFGVILVTTGPGKIYENKIVHQTLSAFTNVFRSIPFVILIAVLTGLTRVISGTIIGAEGVIFPLIVACTPFFIRQVDLSLSEVDSGLIEAAQSMGLSRLQIIWKVYLRESIPSIFRSISITLISLLGLSASGAVVGGGGLASFVIRYGHGRSMADVTWVGVIVILVIVFIIQIVCDIIIKKTTH
ncbi:methionine ABC transporter permease [Erysipelothrix aquatica]|uniref:methionine ABC transporter permease n=1 Tax=Erysipelothrix aquatica TaxID=2683714 RepID=UPI00135AFCC9|nr:methionine ABC transporter permease [Erysipelothrix aquatica]